MRRCAFIALPEHLALHQIGAGRNSYSVFIGYANFFGSSLHTIERLVLRGFMNISKMSLHGTTLDAYIGTIRS